MLDGDGVVGFGFSTVVDDCNGNVYALLLNDDESPCVAFHFDIVVPNGGFFVSLISVMVV